MFGEAHEHRKRENVVWLLGPGGPREMQTLPSDSSTTITTSKLSNSELPQSLSCFCAQLSRIVVFFCAAIHFSGIVQLF